MFIHIKIVLLIINVNSVVIIMITNGINNKIITIHVFNIVLIFLEHIIVISKQIIAVVWTNVVINGFKQVMKDFVQIQQFVLI